MATDLKEFYASFPTTSPFRGGYVLIFAESTDIAEHIMNTQFNHTWSSIVPASYWPLLKKHYHDQHNDYPYKIIRLTSHDYTQLYTAGTKLNMEVVK